MCSFANIYWKDKFWTLDSGDQKDSENSDDIDLEELGRALSQAASMASRSKKQQSNNWTDTTLNSSPKNQMKREADEQTPVLPCSYMYIQEDSSTRDVTPACLNIGSLSIQENESDQDEAQEEKCEVESYEYDHALNADRTYLNFEKWLDEYPEQCFRYSYGGKLLASGY